MEQINAFSSDYCGYPVIFQSDGYINATQAAKHFGKKPSHFLATDRAKKKIFQVAEKLTLKENQIVISLYGSPETGGGTWFHPKLAVPFAMWLDDDFAWWVEEQIEKILKGETPVTPKSVETEYAELFMDMALLNPPHPGYYSVMKASADMLYACIGSGMPFNQHSIAIISIGKFWKKYWDQQNLSDLYGDPQKFRQSYPAAFPQSEANQLIDVWHYPSATQDIFERWLADIYLVKHYRKYLKNKVSQGLISQNQFEQQIIAVTTRYNLPAPL